MTAIDALALALAGRPAIVLGSAPLDGPPPDGGLIVVNGAISSTPRTPDAWIVNSRRPPLHWALGRQRLARLMLAQAAGRTVPLAVFLTRSPDAPATTLDVLRRQGTVVGAWHAVGSDERRQLEHDAGARPNVADRANLSAGLTAAAFALLAGARPVQLVGFSWGAGYAYLPGERLPNARGHALQDVAALRCLAARYGDGLRHALPDRV